MLVGDQGRPPHEECNTDSTAFSASRNTPQGNPARTCGQRYHLDCIAEAITTPFSDRRMETPPVRDFRADSIRFKNHS
jgi:hypothetical protein